MYMCVRSIDFALVITIFQLDFRIVPTVWYSSIIKNGYTLQLDTLIYIRSSYIVEMPFRQAKENCTLYDDTSIITNIPQWRTYWTAYQRYELLYWLNDDNDEPIIHQGIYIILPQNLMIPRF